MYGRAGVDGALRLFEEGLVTGGFDAEDKADVYPLKFLNERGIGIEGIGHGNQGQMGMFATRVGHKAFGRVVLAVVFRLAVGAHDRLGGQGDHLFERGMHQRRT